MTQRHFETFLLRRTYSTIAWSLCAANFSRREICRSCVFSLRNLHQVAARFSVGLRIGAREDARVESIKRAVRSALSHADQPMQLVGVALELLARAVEHDATTVHHGSARRDVEGEPR